MSFGAIGVGIGVAGLGLSAYNTFANSGGGGGGGIDSKSIKETMEAYLAQVRAAIEAGRTQVAGSVKGMDKKIQKGVKELRGASDAETKAFWNNLGISNEGLVNTASALVESYDGDVMAALGALETNIGRLNEGYSEDMGAEIARFGSVGEAINAQLAADKDVAETKFLDRVNQFKNEYRQDSLGEIDASKSEQMALGDEFVRKTDAALGNFESFISGPNASQTLDELSRSIFRTRQDLLAQADPRALELSAIADENAAAMMSGRISADVQANVARSSAMRALQGGFGASSEMGRGLAARDLGLTSLDLMTRGAELNDAQRRLNYDTRVAGIENSALGMFGEMRAGQSSLMQSRIGAAESDRNQRVGAVQEASGQRLQTFDRLFGANMGVADTLRGQDMTLAGQLSDNRRDDNIRGTGMRIAATQDIYNNNFGVANTVFNAGMGLAGQRLSTGLSVAGDIYKTNVGGAGTVYGSRLGIESGIFDARTRGAIAGMQAITGYENSALQAMSGALGDAAATQANIPVMQAAQRQGQAMQSAQLWGSALQAGSSLAGSYLGSQNWNANQGRTFGGGWGSAGAAANAAPFASSVSYTKGIGYVPVAGAA